MVNDSNKELTPQAARERAAAVVFSKAAELLRRVARNQDYFVGYSVAEAVSDRLAQIGTPDAPETTGPNGRQTQLSALYALRQEIVTAIDTLTAQV